MTKLRGTERPLPYVGKNLEARPDPDAMVDVTVVLQPNLPLPEAGAQVMPREDHLAVHGARPSDVQAVVGHALDCGLAVMSGNYAKRTVQLRGELRDVEAAFGTQTRLVSRRPGQVTRVRSGALHVPEHLAPSIVTVLGIDERPVAQPYTRQLSETEPKNDAVKRDIGSIANAFRPAASSPQSLTALQVAEAYNFPTSTKGQGQLIKLIELGGGFRQADLDSYFSALGLPTSTVVSVGVGGAANVPGGDPQGADGEVELDIMVAAAVAPEAVVVVYFGKNTDAGFLAAINAAIHDTKYVGGVISISWGGPEDSWTASALTAYDQAFQSAAALGMTVLAAAGDSGSSDGESGVHADFPASSPSVIACGGTRLLTNSDGSYGSEQVWNDNPTSSAGGGGYSTHFPLPAYQAGMVPGSKRGVPDVSGNADPVSGYEIVVDGNPVVIGGTSAVAPLYAGLAALLAASGVQLGTLLQALYAPQMVPALHDVTEGSNGAYRAAQGWDAASGLGSLDGERLLTVLNGGTVTPTPPPPPPPGPTPAPVPTPPPGGGTPTSGCFHTVGPFDDRTQRRLVRDAGTAGFGASPKAVSHYLTHLIKDLG